MLFRTPIHSITLNLNQVTLLKKGTLTVNNLRYTPRNCLILQTLSCSSSYSTSQALVKETNTLETKHFQKSKLDLKKKKKHEHRHKLHICGITGNLQTSIATLIENYKDGDTIQHNALKIFDSLRSTSGILQNSHIKLSSLVYPDQSLTPHHLPYDQEPMLLAYLATRLPNHYVAITRALQELKKKLPHFNPQTILDFGTGPGTAIWAYKHSEFYQPSMPPSITAMDINRSMLDMAQKLGKELNFLDNIKFLEYLPSSVNTQFDLSMASFVFSEMEDPIIFKKSVESLWELTKDIVVIVDRGTPAGFHRLLLVRDTILQSGNAQVIAPCPHSNTCPLAFSTRDWCHFSQRMQRTPEMQKAKHGIHKGEDIRFSFMILRKLHPTTSTPSSSSSNTSSNPLPESCTWSRIVSIPIKRGGHILLDLCTKEGTLDRCVITKKEGKDVYKVARKIGWGDQFPHPVSVVWKDRGLGRPTKLERKTTLEFKNKPKKSIKESDSSTESNLTSDAST